MFYTRFLLNIIKNIIPIKFKKLQKLQIHFNELLSTLSPTSNSPFILGAFLKDNILYMQLREEEEAIINDSNYRIGVSIVLKKN